MKLLSKLQSLSGVEFDIGHEMLHAVVTASKRGNDCEAAARAAGYLDADRRGVSKDAFVDTFAELCASSVEGS